MYEVLDVPETATMGDIRDAFIKKSKEVFVFVSGILKGYTGSDTIKFMLSPAYLHVFNQDLMQPALIMF